MLSPQLQDRLRDSLLPRRAPSMLDWARSAIVVPDGPYRGQLFDPDLQPFSRLFFEAVDSGRWDRIAVTAPTQTGKTLVGYVIPVLYHVFALTETVVAGLPSLDMASDKWQQDFLPVIEASPQLRRYLPTKGAGSRAGKVRTAVKFANGATLRFMTAGGSDKSRAGFTARVLAITEVDGMDEPGATSREADKVKQLEARQRAYLATGTRTYLECTVSTTAGRIWQEYTGGTESRIVRPCPHCKAWVTPEREHLIGWQEAAHELEARANAAWSCPECAAPWTEAERHSANLQSKLIHRGQEITPEGQIVGPVPPTRTLGFRWTAVDNHFATAADVAADEWHGKREKDRDNAEKKLRQFVHCLPWDPPDVALLDLQPEAVAKRTAGLKKGILPADCVGVSIGVDTGKRELNWVAIAWAADGRGHVIEYGRQAVAADKLGVTQGLMEALRSLATYFNRGWQTTDGRTIPPSQVWIDSGYAEHQPGVFEFCYEASKGIVAGSERYRPSKGYGEGQRRMERYWVPRKLTADVRYIAPGYDLRRSGKGKLLVAHVNADVWKSELHQRLCLPADSPLALSLYESPNEDEHRDFAEQLTAERQVEKYVEGKGETVVWERMRRRNHALDAAYAAVAAGDLVLRLVARATAPRLTMKELAEQAARKRAG